MLVGECGETMSMKWDTRIGWVGGVKGVRWADVSVVSRWLTFQGGGMGGDFLYQLQILFCVQHFHIAQPWRVVEFERFQCGDVLDVHDSFGFPPGSRSGGSACRAGSGEMS